MPEPRPPKGQPYATSIPDRRPEVKVYDSLGLAKRSISVRQRYTHRTHVSGWQYQSHYVYPDAAMYEWTGTEWVEIYRVREGDTSLPWE